MENGSPDGVITAASTTTAHIAWRLNFFIKDFVTIPIEDKAMTTVGNSNTIPNVMTVDNRSDIYDVSENVLGTSGLT